MKILMVNDYKDTIGGAELYMYNLADTLKSRGYEVEFFFSEANHEQYRNHMKKQSIGLMLSRIFNIKAYTAFKKYIQTYRPDIIHLHGITNELSPSILLATNHIPVVMTVHNNLLVNAVSVLSARTGKPCQTRTCRGCTNCVGMKGALYEYIKRHIHKPLLSKITLFISPSRYMQQFMEEATYKPVICIANGITLMPYREIVHYENILYVGRLSIDKGVEYLLKAMPLVIKKFPNIQLTLIGDGEAEKYFKEIVKKLTIPKSVYFIGKIPQERVKKHYADSTIVVIPSIYDDNFPTVCLEAMSVGRPMIGTNMGGIPELITDGKSGCIVEPANENDLAEKIITMLSDKHILQRMSQWQRKRSKEFSIQQHTDTIERIYAQLLH